MLTPSVTENIMKKAWPADATQHEDMKRLLANLDRISEPAAKKKDVK